MLDNVQSDYDKKYGTGSAFRRGVSAATAVLQGLLTGNNRQALVGGLSPYANEFIKGQTEENSLENKIAHGILSAVENNYPSLQDVECKRYNEKIVMQW